LTIASVHNNLPRFDVISKNVFLNQYSYQSWENQYERFMGALDGETYQDGRLTLPVAGNRFEIR